MQAENNKNDIKTLDIIPYDSDPAKFIENALSPARDLHVFITDEEEKQAYVIVNDENLSLAIGKKGLNVKLASRLTKYKIDVKNLELLLSGIKKKKPALSRLELSALCTGALL